LEKIALQIVRLWPFGSLASGSREPGAKQARGPKGPSEGAKGAKGGQSLTAFCKIFGRNADFEVNFLALFEEIDGIFLSYALVLGTPWVCDAFVKSRHEFFQAFQSRKVVRLWPPPYLGAKA